jgi:DNA-binding XRE family transcriptional regulator
MCSEIREANETKRGEEVEEQHKDTSTVRAAENDKQPAGQKEVKTSTGREAKTGKGAKSTKRKRKRSVNNVRKFRIERMMSKAELARRAGISPLTVDRVERGLNCRMDTKRKILEALGLQPSDRKMVFPNDD